MENFPDVQFHGWRREIGGWLIGGCQSRAIVKATGDPKQQVSSDLQGWLMRNETILNGGEKAPSHKKEKKPNPQIAEERIKIWRIGEQRIKKAGKFKEGLENLRDTDLLGIQKQQNHWMEKDIGGGGRNLITPVHVRGAKGTRKDRKAQSLF